MPQPDPTIPVFPAGYGPVAADMAAWITNPFTFLTSKVMFRGQRQAAQALTGPGFNQASLDTILEDPYGGWSAVATGSQPAFSWLCPAGCSGWYEVTLTGTTNNPGTATDQIGAALFVDGTDYAQASSGWGVNGNTAGASGVVQVPLLAGNDYVQLFINTTVSVNTPATAGQYPTMEIAWIST